jgi:hypothetical protein
VHVRRQKRYRGRARAAGHCGVAIAAGLTSGPEDSRTRGSAGPRSLSNAPRGARRPFRLTQAPVIAALARSRRIGPSGRSSPQGAADAVRIVGEFFSATLSDPDAGPLPSGVERVHLGRNLVVTPIRDRADSPGLSDVLSRLLPTVQHPANSGSGRMNMKRSLVATIAVALAASLAACGGGEPNPDPTPSTPATTSPSPTSSSQAGGPPAGWESKFTPIELAAARDAMGRWEQYRQLSAEIYKEGKLTPGAKATLQKYDFGWQRDIVTLDETYEKGGLRRVSDVKALWSYVKSVELDEGGETGDLVIVQCTDYRPLRYTRNGKPQDIDKPKHMITPLLVRMTKPDKDHGWMYYKAILKDKASCSAG